MNLHLPINDVPTGNWRPVTGNQNQSSNLHQTNRRPATGNIFNVIKKLTIYTNPTGNW
jgi:hypothetical protein